MTKVSQLRLKCAKMGTKCVAIRSASPKMGQRISKDSETTEGEAVYQTLDDGKKFEKISVVTVEETAEASREVCPETFKWNSFVGKEDITQ